MFVTIGEKWPDGIVVCAGGLDEEGEGLGVEVLRPKVEYFCRDKREWIEGRGEGKVDCRETM